MEFGWKNMQYCSANEDMGDQQLFADIPGWEEIFDDPIRTPQQEEQMLITQISSRINLRLDQLQPQQEDQCWQSLSSCAFSPSSQLPLTMQNQISFPNQKMPISQMFPQINLKADQLQPQQQHQCWQSFSSCAFSPSSQLPLTMQNQISFPNQLPVYPATNQLHDQHLQQQIQQNSLPSIQPYDFSPSRLCPSTIQYQSNLKRIIMSHKPTDPHLQTNQAAFSLPKGRLSSAQIVVASAATKLKYQDHLYRQKHRTQAPPPYRVPVSLLRSSTPRNVQLPLTLNGRGADAKTPRSMKNFLRRFHNADPEEKEKLTEMRDLINLLRKSRESLGLSRSNLSLKMSTSETPITLGNIQSLENFSMSLDNMWKFKPLMQHWLEETGWLAKEPTRIISYSSVKAAYSSIRSWETQATFSTTNSQVLENDIQQSLKHGLEVIAILDKSLNTDKEDLTSWTETRFQKEENLIHNYAVCSDPHYPPVLTPDTTLDVYQLQHDRSSQPKPTNYTTHLLPCS